MLSAKKIELVIDKIYVNKIIECFDRNNIEGYTIIKDVTGKGSRGEREGDDITNVFKNSYIFTICDDEKLKKVIPEIQDIINVVGGICIVSEVKFLKSKKP